MRRVDDDYALPVPRGSRTSQGGAVPTVLGIVREPAQIVRGGVARTGTGADSVPIRRPRRWSDSVPIPSPVPKTSETDASRTRGAIRTQRGPTDPPAGQL